MTDKMIWYPEHKLTAKQDWKFVPVKRKDNGKLCPEMKCRWKVTCWLECCMLNAADSVLRCSELIEFFNV